MESTLKRTWAEISLDNLTHNFETIRRQVGPKAKLLGVVKADAYGHGAVRVAQRLQRAGCQWVAVNCYDEAEELRAAGVDSFVYKNVGTAELIAVIRSTMEGYSTFPRPQSNALSGAAALTQTEIDILRLVCETKTRKEIAQELYLSEGTVKRHISEILAKTGYDNILRLAVHAVASGLIIPGMGRTGEQTEE